MPARVRMSASAPWMISSKGFERWLISRIDMPTPGSETRSRCTCSSTSSGSTAGPAAKLKMRDVVVAMSVSLPGALGFRELVRCRRRTERHHADVKNIGIARLDPVQQRVGRLAVEVNPGDCRLRAGEHDVLGFLGVDLGVAQHVEDARE